MAKHRSIKEQLRQLMTQEEEDFLGRIGIVLHGTKAIAEYMGFSPASISRWRTRYRGREEFRLCFPAILMPTGKGWGFRMIAHTALIKEWLERWQEIDCAEAQEKAKSRRRPPKVKRIGETRKELAGQFEGGDEKGYARDVHKCPTVREEPVKLGPTDPAQREESGVKVGEMPAASQAHQTPASKEPCPCGVPSRCLVHNEWPLEKESVRPIYEEPPVKVEIRPEVSGAAELPPAKVSKNVRTEGCTCGTLTSCTAHD
jgi:hypothetical protein